MKPRLRILVLLLIGFSLTHVGLAQEGTGNLFPKATLGFSGGIFRPALNEINEDHRKDILFGSHLMVNLLTITPNQRLYGVVQLNLFGATKFGPSLRAVGTGAVGLLKWDMRLMNYGLRYGVRLFGWKAVSWAGGGVSTIVLDRKDIRSRNQAFESISYELRDRFRSVGFYIEVGQLVQSFIFDARPRVGLFWNAKYDHGRSDTGLIGGFSLRGGALIGL